MYRPSTWEYGTVKELSLHTSSTHFSSLLSLEYRNLLKELQVFQQKEDASFAHFAPSLITSSLITTSTPELGDSRTICNEDTLVSFNSVQQYLKNFIFNIFLLVFLVLVCNHYEKKTNIRKLTDQFPNVRILEKYIKHAQEILRQNNRSGKLRKTFN